ncbi:MAG: type I methionyl aminopeptidase [Alphaproteobacteria bacterium]|jgi:methionyl aminopeptidase|nr:type I methionyl aminopeptidase [Alphaproteobacteria bacterium]
MNKNFIIKKVENYGQMENIYIYNQEAFVGLKKAGLLAYKTLEYIKDFVKAGVSTDFLDSKIHDFIIANNAIPATLGYRGYTKSSCISLNHEICHGIPSDKKLIEGDILNIDVTVILDGWYGDTSSMFSVGKISPKAQRLMATTLECIEEAIKIVRPGIHIGDIGATIEAIAHKNRFSVVEDFCGHGVGSEFHQDPNILHYGNFGEGMVIEEGMVFTIEPMINFGKKDIKMLSNGWTAITKDFSLSAQYEHTIGVSKDGCVIFTLP